MLDVLDARGVEVPDAARERIVGCDDLRQLDRWIRLATTTKSVDDLFAAP